MHASRHTAAGGILKARNGAFSGPFQLEFSLLRFVLTVTKALQILTESQWEALPRKFTNWISPATTNTPVLQFIRYTKQLNLQKLLFPLSLHPKFNFNSLLHGQLWAHTCFYSQSFNLVTMFTKKKETEKPLAAGKRHILETRSASLERQLCQAHDKHHSPLQIDFSCISRPTQSTMV